MNKNISYKLVCLVFSILVICFAIGFYVIAWTEPTEAPPEGNVPAPLNVGPDGQAKQGGLILNTGGAENGLIVDQGKIGFGDTTPDGTLKLDVEGQIGATEYCDENGDNCRTSTQLFEDCDILHAYDSSEHARTDVEEAVTIPNYCKGNNVCNIILRRYISGEVTHVRVTFYSQALNGIWESRFQYAERNGDSTQTQIVPNIDAVNLYDDYATSENNQDQWTYWENESDDAGELIVCPN